MNLKTNSNKISKKSLVMNVQMVLVCIYLTNLKSATDNITTLFGVRVVCRIVMSRTRIRISSGVPGVPKVFIRFKRIQG